MAERHIVQLMKRGTPHREHKPLRMDRFKESLHLLELAIRNKAEKVPLHRHADVLSKSYKGPCLEPRI
jgi:hypothetical protein